MTTAKQTERREKLARNINIIMEAYHISIKEPAAELDRDRHIVSLRIKCPWLFTLEDLEGIAAIWLRRCGLSIPEGGARNGKR